MTEVATGTPTRKKTTKITETKELTKMKLRKLV